MLRRGNRLGTLDSQEEVNRITIDHAATLNFCATEDALDKLKREGLGDRSHCVGSIMYDSFLHFADQPWDHPNILDFDGNSVMVPETFYNMTCHQQENTYSDELLTEILLAMNRLDAPMIYAVHPRNHERAKRIAEKGLLEHYTHAARRLLRFCSSHEGHKEECHGFRRIAV